MSSSGVGVVDLDEDTAWTSPTSSSTTRTPRTRQRRSHCRGSPTPAPSPRPRSATSRQVDQPTYDDLARGQVETAVGTSGLGDLAALIAGKYTWAVGEPRQARARRRLAIFSVRRV